MNARLLLAMLASCSVFAAEAGAQDTIPDEYLGRYAIGSCQQPDSWLVIEPSGIRLFDQDGREEAEDVRVLSITPTTQGVSLLIDVENMRGTLDMRWVSSDRLEVSFAEEGGRDVETELLLLCDEAPPPDAGGTIESYLFDSSAAAFGELVAELASECVPGGEVSCLDTFWTFADVTGDGLLTTAELARVGRHAAQWTASEEAPFLRSSERVVVHLGALLAGPLAARVVVDNYDYDDNGAVSRVELFPDGAENAPLTIDALLALFTEQTLEDIGEALEDLDRAF